MDWCHPDASAHDCTGPDVSSSPNCSSVRCAAISGKPRLLLVSFSESETAFLSRTAKILALTGKWECSCLLLHALGKDNPVTAEFDAVGIGHFASSESRFYDEYAHSESAVAGSGFSDRVHQHCRRLKTSRLPHQRMLGRLLEVALFVPWLFRYGIRYGIGRVVVSLKQWLRGSHPGVYSWLRRRALAFQSYWDEIPLVSEYQLKIKKVREERRLRKYRDAAGSFFATQAPDLLMLAKDSAYYSTTVFVQAARNMGIPSVVIPYDRADTETLAKDRLGHPDHVIRSHAAREIATQFPSWVYTYDGQPLLLAAPATVYALEELDLAPPNPWGYNNSRCDKIFLETEEDRQMFLTNGAPDHQLVVIGAPYMDNLDEMLCQQDRLRAELCSSFAFDPAKPFVVASVPPNKVSQRATEIEFQDYRTLIEKWSSALAKNLACNLIYSLHPLTDPADVGFIEKTGGKILQRPLEELLAAADLYVVDCSSTARWARYAGLDVIDYDVYRYNLWFNSDIKGVRHITSYEQFLVELTAARERLQRERNPVSKSGRQPPALKFGERLRLELEDLLISYNRKVRNVV